jgi:cytochrome P450
LGVPAQDIERFRHWSEDLATVIGSARLTEDRYGRGARALFDLTAYFEDIVAARRRRGLDDALIDSLIRAHDEAAAESDGGETASLSEAELVANAILILFAGHETTTNLIGNGIIALAANPDQERKLRAEPSLIRQAVEEMLRYDSPAQAMVRIAADDVELHDRKIAKGDRLFLMLNAANRDPLVYEDPERFDIGRADNRHIAFGHGIHFCVGAELARTEGEIAIPALLARFPRLRLAGADPEWDDSLVLRGVKSLPVRTD